MENKLDIPPLKIEPIKHRKSLQSSRFLSLSVTAVGDLSWERTNAKSLNVSQSLKIHGEGQDDLWIVDV